MIILRNKNYSEIKFYTPEIKFKQNSINDKKENFIDLRREPEQIPDIIEEYTNPVDEEDDVRYIDENDLVVED